MGSSVKCAQIVCGIDNNPEMKSALTLLVVLSFLSCSKNNGDTQKPVVVLNTPVGGQQFSAGTIVHITGTVTDNDEIHMVHVIVTDLTHDVEVHHLMYHADAPSYNFDETLPRKLQPLTRSMLKQMIM